MLFTIKSFDKRKDVTITTVGWKKDFIEQDAPYMPTPGWMSDNLLIKSYHMAWWTGQDVEVGEATLRVEQCDVMGHCDLIENMRTGASQADVDLIMVPADGTSDNMAWWTGQDVDVRKETLHVETLYDVTDVFCYVPGRPASARRRMPLSGIHNARVSAPFSQDVSSRTS